MKKIIFAFGFLALTLSVSSVFGQSKKSSSSSKLRFGVGPTLSIPTGDLQDVSGVGFGGELLGIYNASDQLDITLQAGYTSFAGKSSVGTKNASLIPVLVGARYKITPAENSFYIGLGLGVDNYNFKYVESAGNFSKSGFAYAPSIGYTLNKFDIAVTYNATTLKEDGVKSNVDFFGLKVLYKF